MRLSEIQIRDPYLVRDPASGDWLLFGSTDPNIWEGPGIGFDTYRSADLQEWSGPHPAFRPPADFWSDGQFWAPEVHRNQEGWFMFATFTGPDGRRGTQVLNAEAPEGPYRPWSDGPVTPRVWQCLDGTLFVDDDGDPWIVFCHEWIQIGDGAVYAQRMSADLKCATGTPVHLFDASSAAWAEPMPGGPVPAYVTDGPFLHRLADGGLVMLWSSIGRQGYAMGVARSTTGRVTGPWTQEPEPLWPADGGHGMIARLDEGELVLTLHQPNDTPNERTVLRRLIETNGTIAIAPEREDWRA
ncbi:glycoside hydrolase family 43 protein [Nocardioides sp. NPDC101246]|uniref:glycoside hydrolase family 43 protein n=1 Tax=Nocardioides sp. NPDC101246 TaxID=3364336 RepID=UPI00381DEB4C